jgi:DNA-binding MarR family transcriptional regulator/GNAT superfamily N-acetyltransferase
MGDRNVTDLGPIDAVRHFNRFYTRQLGLLDEGLLDSDFSLSEARILYELAHRDEVTASEMCNELGLDAGYLSRVLKKFATRELVSRKISAADARQVVLSLTDAGRAAFEPLNRASQNQVSGLLSGLSGIETNALLEAMMTIERLLGARAAAAVPYSLRPHQIGDMGWVVHRQGILYAQEYGWDETFEALVAEIVAAFIKNYDPRWERCWIAERDRRIVGSVFLVRESATIAKLRLLYVEREARGLGIGNHLVDECIRVARQKGYKTLTLWTNDVLISARRIYQAAGFKLVAEERHHSFGQDLVGQNWDLEL